MPTNYSNYFKSSQETNERLVLGPCQIGGAAHDFPAYLRGCHFWECVFSQLSFVVQTVTDRNSERGRVES